MITLDLRQVVMNRDAMANQVITVRRAEGRDEKAIREMSRRAYQATPRAYYDDDAIRRMIAAAAAPVTGLIASGRYFIATNGERVIGCGGWTPWPPGKAVPLRGARQSGVIYSGRGAMTTGRSVTGHVRRVAVDPDFAAGGVGDAVMAAATDQARIEGVTQFDCVSTLFAEGFYAKLGFDTLEYISIKLGDRDILAAAMRRQFDRTANL